MKISNQYAVRSAQLLRLTAYCALITAYCALTSCGPKPVEGDGFEIQGVPRLAKYYPVVTENGDTTYETPPTETFINQDGDSFSTASLKGNIVVMQIFFASCKGICPVISHNMEQLQKDFSDANDVRMVSLSVDPERDSVPALKAFSELMNADAARWVFLSGNKKKTYDYIRYGLRLPNVEPGNGDSEDFIHSDQLVLIDKDNIIRGYYGGTDTAQVRWLREDIETLRKEK